MFRGDVDSYDLVAFSVAYEATSSYPWLKFGPRRMGFLWDVHEALSTMRLEVFYGGFLAHEGLIWHLSVVEHQMR